MKKSYYHFHLFIIIGLLMPAFLLAGWFKVHDNPGSVTFYRGYSYTYDLSLVYAVAQDGWVYKSTDQGTHWLSYQAEPGKDLFGITVGQNTDSSFLFVCGENGALARYNFDDDRWHSYDGFTTNDLFAINFNYSRSETWVAGDSNFVAISKDAYHWQTQPIAAPLMKIKAIFSTYEKTILLGDDSQNIYIHYLRTLPDSSVQEDSTITLENLQVVAVVPGGNESSDKAIFLAKDINTDEIHLMQFSIYDPYPIIEDLGILPFNNAISIGLYANYINYMNYYWVGTANGEIWESYQPQTKRALADWKMVYREPSGSAIYSFIASDAEGMRGMAFGENELALLNSFKIKYLDPAPNQVVNHPVGSVHIQFSAIPDAFQLQRNTFVFSNYSGLLNFTVSYDPSDSTRVIYYLLRSNPLGSIPGETWDFSFAPGIVALGDSIDNLSLSPIQFGYTFAQTKKFDFSYDRENSTKFHIKAFSTNWVAGFFNDDDLLDFITFGNNQLYCFYRQRINGDSVVQKEFTKSFPNLITVSKPIYHQILVANLNNDNLPDLILYDANAIHFLINQSTNSTIDFRLANSQYQAQNIRQVIAYNDNNNAQIDLLVLGNSLDIVNDVTADNNNFNISTIYYQANAIEKVAVGNVDDDLANDLVMISNGNVLYCKGSAQYGLNYGSSADTLTHNGIYYNVKLANLDNDNRLEILAMSSEGLDVIPIYHNLVIGKTTPESGSLIRFNPNMEPPSDFIIQDFGGDPTTDIQNPLDIAILQEDSLYIYRNQTTNIGNFVFGSSPEFKMSLGTAQFPFDRLNACDYNARGELDIVATDFETGLAEIFGKTVWKPTLQVVERDAHHIHLHWDPSPISMGTLDHYVIFKTTNSDTGHVEFISNENDFVDFDVNPFNTYTYTVQAVYQEQSQSLLSNLVSVNTYYELNGEQSGVLADTTLPYWAKSNLIVPTGDSLRILPGIHIEFDQGTGFEIRGHCTITGDTSSMVDFSSRDSIWKGISLSDGADTVHFAWFSINHAQTAIQSNGRPFKLQYGGIEQNKTGIQAEQCEFFLKNIFIDSCGQGISVGNGSMGHLKNITLLHSEDYSVFAQGNGTQISIKNAIIWENKKPIFAQAPASIDLHYSTVDSIGMGVITKHISHLAPRFNPGSDQGPAMIDPMSPTIDAGDPNDDFHLEPQPNGNRINQGVFGNTPFATPSLQPRIKAHALSSHLSSFSGQKDSTLVIIKNWGYANLNIQDLHFAHSQANGPFFISQSNTTQGIASQDSLTLKLLFQPPKRGFFSDSLVIVCDDPHLKEGRLLLPVSGQGLNSLPHIINTPPTTALVDSPYVFKPIIKDADNDSVVVTPLRKPDWLIWENGMLHGTPTLSDTGANPVSLKLDDLFGGTDTLQFVITVNKKVQLHIIAPVLQVSSAGKSIITQAAVRFRIAVFDSLKTGLKEATASYRMRLFLQNETTGDTLRIDTTAVPEFTFTKLKDGKYKIVFLAFKKSLGRLLHAEVIRLFTIKASQKTTARFRWIMASLPRDTVFDVSMLHFKDSSAVLFHWNAQTEKYELLNNETISPGMAFWIMPLKILHIDLNSFPIRPSAKLPQGETKSAIKLNPGWNQVGLPLPYYERWVDCRLVNKQGQEISWEAAFGDSLISPVVYWFEQSNTFIGYHVQPIDSNAVAIPWRGYWLFANEAFTLYLPESPYIPNEEGAPLAKPLTLENSSKAQDAFLMNLTVACDHYRDDYNVFGLSSSGNSTLPEPPYFKDFVALSFESGNHSLCQAIKKQPTADDAVVRWPITLRTTFPEKTHHLQWQQLDFNREPLFLYLVDQKSEKVINMNEQTEYDFTPQKATYALMIYASKDAHFKPALIPLDYKVEQNYPNPFNPRTTIRVGIPQSGKDQHVTLKIYDVLGKEVKTLFDGNLQPGFHKLEWDGTNSAGNAVSSGIYFYRLQAANKGFMRKMILLR